MRNSSTCVAQHPVVPRYVATNRRAAGDAFALFYEFIHEIDLIHPNFLA